MNTKKYIISSIILSILAPFIFLIFGGVIFLIEEGISSIMWKMNWAPFTFSFNISDNVFALLTYALQILCYIIIAICLFRLFRVYKAKTGSLRSVFYPSLLAILSLGLSLFSIFSSAGY